MWHLLLSAAAMQPLCDAPERKLSYRAPQFYPYPPYSVVLETAPGACDLAAPYNEEPQKRATWCKAFTEARLPQPEPFVAQAVASALAHCPFTAAIGAAPCDVVDIGGNLGLVTAMMASLGANVQTVEPSKDLAHAIKQTVAANCWQDRVTVHQKGITADSAADGSTVHFNGGCA